MEEKYLVVNAGSSSLKYSLYNAHDKRVIVSGNVEKINEDGSCLIIKANGEKKEIRQVIKNHEEAVEIVLNMLLENNFISSLDEIKGVGHRILHGGEYYNDSVLINEEVKSNIESLIPLGPLHLPGEILGVECFEEKLPNVPQVAVFDTAFHQSIPKENYVYALPYDYYEKYGYRKYGFHGTSHKYITEQMQNKLGRKDINIISCHLGNGSSITAIKDGKSYDTTMGMTPLAGLIMGTRSGDIDPSLVKQIAEDQNISLEETLDILNYQSGLIGICGKNDLRDIEKLYEAGDERAKIAVKKLVRSIVKNIVDYYVLLEGNVDAIVFTAGIGENSKYIREFVVKVLSSVMPLKLDEKTNNQIAGYEAIQEGIITTEDSELPIFVLHTDEEIKILEDTIDIIANNEKLMRTGVK